MNKMIADVFRRVSNLEGVEAAYDKDALICIDGDYFKYYCLVDYLGMLLERGEMTIKFNPPERLDRVKILLGMKDI